jgi:hypothetical protein
MLSTVELRGSCSPLSTIAVALVAFGVAGCSADVTRFSNSAFPIATDSNEVSGSLSLPSSGPATTVARPKADLGDGGSSIAVGPANTVVRAAGPRARPIRLSYRHGKTAAFTRGKDRAANKKANRRPGDLIARGSPARRAQEPAERRSTKGLPGAVGANLAMIAFAHQAGSRR